MSITSAGKTLSLIWNVLDTTKNTFSPIEFDERKPLLSPNGERFFERVTPESCGIDSEYIRDYVRELCDDRRIGLHSIMLMRDGKVFFEATKRLQDEKYPKATFSECKSVVALAIGVLVTKGQLKLNEKVVNIFSDKASPMAKIVLGNLTVKHLLNMTSPVTFGEAEAMVTKDWIKGYLNSDVEGSCGRKFKYNSLNTYMLSAIIIERTGMSLSEFLDSSIFGSLKITDYYWEKCPNGLEKGGWGLYIRREDMAKLGVLVMQKGVWNGKRLVSDRFLEEATKAKIAAPTEFGDYDYGYHIWSGRECDSFLFNGVYGQNLLGYRDSKIIIVSNCGNGDTFQQSPFFDITHKYFNREFKNMLQENAEKQAMLDELKAQFASGEAFRRKSFLSPSKNTRDLQEDLSMLDGKRFSFSGSNATSTGIMPLLLQLMQGNYTKGLTEIDFKKRDDKLEISFIENDETHKLNVGFSEPVKSIVSCHNEVFTLLSIGHFTENEDGIPTLMVDCDFMETPFSRCYKFYFDKATPYAIFSEAPGNDISRIASVVSGTMMPNIEKMGNMVTKFDGDYFNVKFDKAFSPRMVMEEIK